MTKLKEGNLAPEFSLRASHGGQVSLKDFRGNKNVVLYFYPKDDTPVVPSRLAIFGTRSNPSLARTP